MNSHIEFSVSDTGIGIPADFLPHVFERFSQKDSSTQREYGGLGLGLAISKQLVELHGGSIQAKSLGEGQGATFVVTLPLIILGKESARIRSRFIRPPPSLPSRCPLPRLDGVRVLVVDDEADARELIRRVLREPGRARDYRQLGRRGAAAAGDLRRPTCSSATSECPAWTATSSCGGCGRPSRRTGALPALALTAFARPEDRKHAILAGYQAHLAKPFDMAELAIVVAGLVGRT